MPKKFFILALLILPCHIISAQNRINQYDINNDGKTNTADVVTIVNFLLQDSKTGNAVPELPIGKTIDLSFYANFVEPTSTTATITGFRNDNNRIKNYGIAFSNIEEDIKKWAHINGTHAKGGIFKIQIHDLTPNTKYRYRTFITTEDSVYYNNAKTFQTTSVPSSNCEINIDEIESGWTEARIATSHPYSLDATTTGVTYAISNTPSTVEHNDKNYSYNGKNYFILDNLQPDTQYDIQEYIIIASDTIYGETKTFRTKSLSTDEAIDLGLSVKWASCNIGASAPEERGLFFAWGEIEGYAKDVPHIFNWDSYSMTNSDGTFVTKYCVDVKQGNKDNLIVLEPEDDAAHEILGEKWRIPTDSEYAELCNKCSWKWTNINGVDGYIIENNNNAIFLPVTGDRCNHLYGLPDGGFYWSSSLYPNSCRCAMRIQFDCFRVVRCHDYRFYGECIRPVTTKN